LEYEQVYDCLFSNPGKLCHDLMLIRARKHLSSMPIHYWVISNTFCIYFLLTYISAGSERLQGGYQ